MFNSDYKKSALNGLKNANEIYQKQHKITLSDVEKLHNQRLESIRIIQEVENLCSSIKNSPVSLKKELNIININRKQFENSIVKFELENKKIQNLSGSISGGGALAGAGVAMFGPTAAMAIATTFGTASTGTAIATLSGAAATNAALAWLGGGALVAGGGGMTAGSALLGLAGPVGWAIGGVALLGGGALASSKNKEIAQKAEKETNKIKIETEKISELNTKVNLIKKFIIEAKGKIQVLIYNMSYLKSKDYVNLNSYERDSLKIILNTTLSLSKKLEEKI